VPKFSNGFNNWRQNFPTPHFPWPQFSTPPPLHHYQHLPRSIWVVGSSGGLEVCRKVVRTERMLCVCVSENFRFFDGTQQELAASRFRLSKTQLLLSAPGLADASGLHVCIPLSTHMLQHCMRLLAPPETPRAWHSVCPAQLPHQLAQAPYLHLARPHPPV
jgi:hypothetical protein